MTARLTEALLQQLPAAVEIPRYDRAATGVGIVHLGVGAFHRAHQAWYTERALNLHGGDWAIIGASLRSAGVREQLNPQDGLYTLVERDGDQQRYQLIGAIKTVLVSPENPADLVAWLSSPVTKVVTLTITEKGYFYSAASGGLLVDHGDIQKDLQAFPENQATAIGLLAAGLASRRENGAGGITLLSCDNLSHNGRVLAKVIGDFVALVDPSLLPWIQDNVTFPCSMVDRIVPATTENNLAELEKTLGYRDEAAVFTEPFNQWVIENKFARGAPDWQAAGALYVDDVTPFETMKLRLLNGSHSLIAYLGFLAGYDFVHQVMADEKFAHLVRLFMDTQGQPTLDIPQGFDIEQYKDNLCQRFANAALNHKTYQIAQDGSQKIPQRWIAPLRQLLAQEKVTDIFALALAGWLRYLEGCRDNGEVYKVDDPLYESTLKASVEAGASVAELLKIQAVFGDLAAENPGFVQQVEECYRRIASAGVAATVATLVKSPLEAIL
jgi:fructuronate reductase